jgi:hypothetical protein
VQITQDTVKAKNFQSEIMSGNYFAQVLNYQKFWIISSQIKGILLYCHFVSTTDYFPSFTANAFVLLSTASHLQSVHFTA